MFNQTGIKKESIGTPNQILFNVEHQVSVGVVVDDTTTVNENGRKIVKAGTPLAGSLDARETAFTVAVSTGETTKTSNAVGVLLHDVDVTAGEANGTLLIFGFVNKNRLDEETKNLITAEAQKAMPLIKFVAC